VQTLTVNELAAASVLTGDLARHCTLEGQHKGGGRFRIDVNKATYGTIFARSVLGTNTHG
jgi:hypothetical protein